MSDMTIPAIPSPGTSTETAAPQVTTQETNTNERAAPQIGNDPAGEPQAKAEAEPAGGDQGEGEHKSWKEKRAERNRARWQEYKKSREALPRLLEMLERENQRLSRAEQPDFNQFADPNEELAQRTAWTVRQQQRAEAEARLSDERKMLAEDHQHKLMDAWAETVEAARETMPDFDTVFNKDTPVHERAIRPIVESDMSAEIAYHLGKHPEEAAALYRTFDRDPVRGLIEFGRLEARLSRPSAKQATAAPKPAIPISGGINPLGFDADKSSVDDMAAHLRAKGLIR